MPATGRFSSFAVNALDSDPISLSVRPRIVQLYLPAILATAVGAVVLSVCWVSLLETNPPARWFITMIVLDVGWILSLSDVWMRNTYYLLDREAYAISMALRTAQ